MSRVAQAQPAMLTMWQTLSTLSTSFTHATRQLSTCKCDKRQQRQQQQKQRSAESVTANAEMQSAYNISNMLLSTATTETITAAAPRRCSCHSKRRNSNNNDNSSSSRLHNNNNSTWLAHMLLLTLLLGSLCAAAQAALRNVNLLVEPPAVRRGQSVALRCDYQLDGAPLYSIKFYRGQMEFYRYTPGEYPHTKMFPYPGIRVDESSSNATLVYIRNVSFGLSGNFSCEVTADAPLYSTATAYGYMQVVEFPEKRPQLFTEHTRYEPGDVLRANCSTPPSRPRVQLRFTINNMPVTTDETEFIRTVDNLIASRLSLKLQLQAVHFANAINGQAAFGHVSPTNAHMTNALGSGHAAGGLLLRCTAQIADLYQEYKEIELGSPQKDPVPARVTLSSGGGLQNFFETYFSTSAANRRTLGHTWPTLSYACCILWMLRLAAAVQPNNLH